MLKFSKLEKGARNEARQPKSVLNRKIKVNCYDGGEGDRIGVEMLPGNDFGVDELDELPDLPGTWSKLRVPHAALDASTGAAPALPPHQPPQGCLTSDLSASPSCCR